jgi:glucose-1-phosphate thymidylyltransferase
MKCVILAAGYGSRLQPFTSHRPKQMLPVGGKPILQHGLEYIRDILNITEIIMVVGYRRDYIMEYFGDGSAFGLKIVYAIQHLNSKRGLGAALQLVEEFISGDFCLYLADNLFGANLKQVVDYHLKNSPSVTLHVEQHENPSRFGVVVADDNNNVIRVVEKPKDPPSNLVITGFYVFSPIIFHHLAKLKPSARGEYELTDAIQSIIESNCEVKISTISGWRQDFGYAEDILESNRFLMKDLGTTIKSDVGNCEIVEPVYIGENCKLENSKIGPFATIGDNTSIIDTYIRESVVLEDSEIINCSINNSVIGSKCKLEGLREHSFKVGDYSQILINGANS